MKRIFSVLMIALFAVVAVSASSPTKIKTKKLKKHLPIQTYVPKRPAGQQHVIGLTTPKMDVVRVGFIGLGMRGPGAVERFTHIPGVEIKALGDIHGDRVKRTQERLKKRNFPEATEYYGSHDAWKAMCERDDIDLIYIVTDWKTHVPMALYAMEHGKHVAVEVPGAMTLEDTWKLLNAAEKYQRHCMMLENCVYDYFELTTLNMVQKGLLGEIVYADGGYVHQLEDFWNHYESDWRMEYNKHHRGDLYPTHGMGPACQVLDIHRGDKMNYLVSMDSKPLSIPRYLEKKRGEPMDDFKNGQQTVTLIRTEKGKTIEIHHDVATPRPYSRYYNVAGTNGYASKYPVQNYALHMDESLTGDIPDHENLNAHRWVSKEMREALMKQYKHPIHVDLEERARDVGGHGGMDFIMDYRLIYCLQNGLPLDMDVYDMAEWSAIVPLSEISLENGSAPVEVPDFTRGYWNVQQGYRHAFVE